MTRSEHEVAVAEYAANTLSHEETKALLVAALKDSSLAQELLRARALRKLFIDTEYRTLIEQELHTVPRGQSDGLRWFRLSWLPAAALLLSLCVGYTYVHMKPKLPTQLAVALADSSTAQRPLSTASPGQDVTLPDEVVAKLLSLQVRHSASVGFGFDKPGPAPVYRIGDPMRLAVSAPPGNQLVVIDVSPHEAHVLYAGPVKAGSVRIPSSNNFLVGGPAGPRQMRLIVLNSEAALPELRTLPRDTVVWDIPYTVAYGR